MRAPLAHVANQVFLDLAEELNRQGVSRKVSADMFGLALRTYLRKIQRLGEGATDRGHSLWEAVLGFLQKSSPAVVLRAEVLGRFHRDEPALVRGVLQAPLSRDRGDGVWRAGERRTAVCAGARLDDLAVDAQEGSMQHPLSRVAARRFAVSTGAALTCWASAASAETSPVQLRVDFGFLGVLQHDYQQGDPGSTFDFHDEGGQDVLFPVSRYIVNVDLAERHRVSLLYQPLELRTRERLARDILVDGRPYSGGQDMEFTYGFPFYRATYEYTAWRSASARFGLGGGLQIRNATIEFSHSDGTNLVTERNVGPVPVLHARFRQELGGPYWFELDADGIYAPVKYLNGNDNGVEGAILDANVRLGIDAVEHVSAFLNVRYLGGGAEGAGDEPDDYTSNWLQFVIVSLGAELH